SHKSTMASGRKSLVRSAVVWLAFRHPKIGDALAAGGRRLQNALDLPPFPNRWQRILDVLTIYWYWRGVAEELPTVRELRMFLMDSPHPASDPDPLQEFPHQGSPSFPSR